MRKADLLPNLEKMRDDLEEKKKTYETNKFRNDLFSSASKQKYLQRLKELD
jgi:hypothetical protein